MLPNILSNNKHLHVRKGLKEDFQWVKIEAESEQVELEAERERTRVEHELETAWLDDGETYEQFSTQLGRCFDHWIEFCNTDKSYDSLKDFMLLDHLMASLSPDLHVYVKEQNMSSLSEAVRLADNLASAHGAYPKAYPGPDKVRELWLQNLLTCEQPDLKRDFSKIVSWMWGNGTYQTLLL